MQPSLLMDRVVIESVALRGQADIKHVLHALGGSSRDGGQTCSVMSASVTFRENTLTRDFLRAVSSRSGSIEPEAAGAFSSSERWCAR